eukprot:PhM_4_TR10088/c0_g1_i1/m.75716
MDTFKKVFGVGTAGKRNSDLESISQQQQSAPTNSSKSPNVSGLLHPDSKSNPPHQLSPKSMPTEELTYPSQPHHQQQQQKQKGHHLHSPNHAATKHHPNKAMAGSGSATTAAFHTITSVSIPKYRSKNSYIEYVVECSKNGVTWQIARRYQQFRVLHAQLASLCPMTTPYHCELGVVPVLAPSSWTEVTNASPELVERRRRYLEIYLEQLLVPKNGFYSPKTALYAFLHEGEVPIATSRSGGDKLIPGLGAAAPTVETSNDDTDLFDLCFDDDDDTHRRQVVACTQENIPAELHYDPLSPTNASEAAVAIPPPPQPQRDPTTHDEDGKECPPASTESGWKEECTQCGHTESISYSLSGWDDFGPCNKCKQYTTWRLIGPEGVVTGSGGRGGGGRRGVSTLAGQKNNCEQCNVAFSSSISGIDCANCGELYCGMCLKYSCVIKGSEEAGEQRVCGACRDALVPAALPPQRKRSGELSGPQSPSRRGEDAEVDGDEVTNASVVTEAMVGYDGGSIDTPSSFGIFPDEPMPERSDVCLDDFELITTLGKGTFGKVVKVRLRRTKEIFAMKVLSKHVIHKRRMAEYIKEERNILSRINHPFIVRLHWAFQTDNHLYLVLDFLPGGELFTHIYHKGKVKEDVARFYVAEMVLALEHLHRHDIAHRDIKPENIVLDRDGHAQLTDFGLARSDFSQARRKSFVGSAEYLAPETVKGDPQTFGVDWWSLGVMMFEMLTGVAPFNAPSNNDVYHAILHKSIDWASVRVSSEAAHLLRRLLTRDIRARLTDPMQIKKHPFFNDILWRDLYLRRVTPPFVPDLSYNDTKYFSKDFTAEWASVNIDAAPKAAAGVLAKVGGAIPSNDFPGFVRQRMTTTTAVAAARSPPPSPRGGQQLDPSSNAVTVDLPSVGMTLINAHVFHGLWRLIKLELVSTSQDRRVSYPWGSDVVGLLFYHPSGTFAMQLSPARRSKFKDATYNRVTAAEMAKAYSTYHSNFGQYEVVPGQNYLVHRVTSSLCPNWSRTEQKRYFHLSGEDHEVLTLYTNVHDVGDGVCARTAMTWKRIGSNISSGGSKTKPENAAAEAGPAVTVVPDKDE